MPLGAGSSRQVALALKITADASGATAGTAKAAGGLDKLHKAGAIARKTLLVGAGAATVLGGVLIKAGENAGTSNARIENITKSMGLFGTEADNVSSRVIKLSDSIAAQTGVDQNSIKTTAAKLLTFKEIAKTADQTGGAFDRATKAAVDLAAAGFGTAESNALQLGKALNDPIKGMTALTRSGVTFSKAEQERIKTMVESGKIDQAQAKILAAVETQVGGTAAATANATDKIKVRASQAAESIGLKLMPTLDKVTAIIIDKFIPGVEKAADWIGKNSTLVLTLTGALAGILAIVAGVSAAISVFSTVMTVVTAVTKTWAAVQAVLNLALNANPIGIVVLAVVALVAAIVLAYKRSETFRKAVQKGVALMRAAWTGLRALVTAVWAAISSRATSAMNRISSITKTARTVATTTWNGIKTTATAIWDPIRTRATNVYDTIKTGIKTARDVLTTAVNGMKTAAVAAFNAMIAPIKTIIGWIDDLISKVKNIKIPKLPNPFGRITGRAGDPLTSSGDPFAFTFTGPPPATAAPGPATIVNIEVNGALDPDAVARQIRTLLDRYDRRVTGLAS